MADNKSVVERLFADVLNRGNPEALARLVAEEYVEQDPYPGQPPGRAGVEWRIAALTAAFPDAQFVLEDVIAEGEKVVARWHMRATHKGEFLGVAATGKRVWLRGIDVYVIRDGAIQAHGDIIDRLGLLEQLGAWPPKPV